jgi:hypothetical protein
MEENTQKCEGCEQLADKCQCDSSESSDTPVKNEGESASEGTTTAGDESAPEA